MAVYELKRVLNDLKSIFQYFQHRIIQKYSLHFSITLVFANASQFRHCMYSLPLLVLLVCTMAEDIILCTMFYTRTNNVKIFNIFNQYPYFFKLYLKIKIPRETFRHLCHQRSEILQDFFFSIHAHRYTKEVRYCRCLFKSKNALYFYQLLLIYFD